MFEPRTLGALDLRAAEGGVLESVLAQPKRIALLVYLAVAAPGRLHRRDALLALFWPEADEARARNWLSQALHFASNRQTPVLMARRISGPTGRRAWAEPPFFKRRGGVGELAWVRARSTSTPGTAAIG